MFDLQYPFAVNLADCESLTDAEKQALCRAVAERCHDLRASLSERGPYAVVVCGGQLAADISLSSQDLSRFNRGFDGELARKIDGLEQHYGTPAFFLTASSAQFAHPYHHRDSVAQEQADELRSMTEF